MQKNEQPSWTLTNARVRSATLRSSTAVASSTPDSVGKRTGHRRARPVRDRDERLELGEQPVLGTVVDEPRRGVERGERVAAGLDRAARDDDLRPGVHPACAANRGARLGIGLGGDRARVDEDEVGRLVAADDGHAPRAEQPCGRIDLGLVDLAAEVDDRRPARRPLGRCVAHAAHGAHQKSGLALIRNPIVPTSPAMRYDT